LHCKLEGAKSTECYNGGSTDYGPPLITDVHFLTPDVHLQDVLMLNLPTVDVLMLNLLTVDVLMLNLPTAGVHPVDDLSHFPHYIRAEMRTRPPTVK
jgi:hypothetical protein